MAKPAKIQVRIDGDVAPLVKQSASDNGRTVPLEVNHVLRKVYKVRKKL